MTDNPLVSNSYVSSNPDIPVRATANSAGKVIQHMRIDLGTGTTEALALSVRLDEGATYTYIGNAAPGSSTASAVWQIKRMTNADTTILFADGDSNFDNSWDDKASLIYL